MAAVEVAAVAEDELQNPSLCARSVDAEVADGAHLNLRDVLAEISPPLTSGIVPDCKRARVRRRQTRPCSQRPGRGWALGRRPRCERTLEGGKTPATSPVIPMSSITSGGRGCGRSRSQGKHHHLHTIGSPHRHMDLLEQLEAGQGATDPEEGRPTTIIMRHRDHSIGELSGRPHGMTLAGLGQSPNATRRSLEARNHVQGSTKLVCSRVQVVCGCTRPTKTQPTALGKHQGSGPGFQRPQAPIVHRGSKR